MKKGWNLKSNNHIYIKCKLSAYPYLEDRIKLCKDQIEIITTKMLGISSPSNYPIVPNDNHSYKNMILEYQEELEEWEKKLIKYQNEYDEVIGIIDSIQDETDRKIIYDAYVVGLNYTRLSHIYNYSNKQKIYEKINRILKNV